MFCPSCRTNLPDGARFCGACGTSLPAPPSVAQATAAREQTCPTCGGTVPAGRRFCIRCGTRVELPSGAGAGAGVAGANGVGAGIGAGPGLGGGAGVEGGGLPRTGPLIAPSRPSPAGGSGMTPMTLGVLGGLAAAALGTFLAWVSVGDLSASGWNGDAQFRIAKLLGITAPIDALVIVVLAAGGLFVVLAPRLGRSAPRIPAASLLAGALIAAIGVLEFLYVRSEGQGVVNPGLGIYLVIAGGAAAAVCSLLDSKRPAAGTRP